MTAAPGPAPLRLARLSWSSRPARYPWLRSRVGYNPLRRGKKSYQPLLCVESNSAHLWRARLRPGDIDPHSHTAELLRDCWSVLPAGIRDLRVRADAGFYHDGFLSELENCGARYAVVATMYPPLRRVLPGLTYQRANVLWEMADCEYRAQSWPELRSHVIARRLIEPAAGPPTLFTLGRYQYREWVTNMDLTPLGIPYRGPDSGIASGLRSR